MKRMFMIWPLLAALAASALVCDGCLLAGLNVEKGSGRVIEKDFDVSGPFHAVELSGVGAVEITQGKPAALRVEAEDNVMSRIAAKVRGGTLVLALENNQGRKKIVPTKGIIFRVTAPKLDQIEVSGAGKIHSNGLKGESLNLDISGAAKVDMALDVDRLNLTASGASTSTFSGRAQDQEIDISGTGKFIAPDLAGQSADITISGAGHATVNVSDTLGVEISGAGSVLYKGDPHVSPEISGAGKVSKLEQ